MTLTGEHMDAGSNISVLLGDRLACAEPQRSVHEMVFRCFVKYENITQYIERPDCVVERIILICLQQRRVSSCKLVDAKMSYCTRILLVKYHFICCVMDVFWYFLTYLCVYVCVCVQAGEREGGM